jgi:DNA polymerase-4
VAEVLDASSGLLATVYPFKRPVRLLGVTLSSLTAAGAGNTQQQAQLDLEL